MASTIRFAGAQGHELVARLELPAAAPRAYALFAHCFTCSKDSKAAAYIGRALAARGIAVLRFDFTGLGQSSGEFADTNFSSNVQDVVSAARYLEAHHGAPEILIGHSLGGTAVLAAALEVATARAVVTIGSPYDARHVARLLKDAESLDARGEATVDIGGRPFRIRKQFFEDLERHDPQRTLRELDRALLVLHSPRDTVVSIDHAAKIFVAARHPKSFVSLDDADHLLTDAHDAAYVAEVLGAWSSRYLPDRASEPVSGVKVIEAGTGKFVQEVYAGRHVLRADEPESAGGTDTGPNPYDLLLGALGACTAMTLRLYAERKQLPLERVGVALRHERIHAVDCEQCETTDGKIERIERVLTLEGPLDAAQRAKLVEIANKCPVHRTLHARVRIETSARAPDDSA
jgi:uncharacterized OsmC-like protein/fermentation-respiration switch protein FrsA (DUF1100 family)